MFGICKISECDGKMGPVWNGTVLSEIPGGLRDFERGQVARQDQAAPRKYSILKDS